MTNRTLDQQCTVTRPGISMIASGLAVEMVASLLQHPLGPAAPATLVQSPTEALPPGASILGVIPHQQRTFLSHGGLTVPLTGQASTDCVACSPRIKQAWLVGGMAWLEQALSRPETLVPVREEERDLSLEVEEFSDFSSSD